MSKLVVFKFTYFIDNVEFVGGDFNFSAESRLRCQGCGELVEPGEQCDCYDEGEEAPDLDEVLVVPCPMCDFKIDAEDFPMHLDEEHFV